MGRLRHLALFLALISGSVQASEPVSVPVEVERTKPDKTKLPMLEFLKANRHFLRGRLDALAQKPLEAEGDAAIDPRYLELQALFDALAADKAALSNADSSLSSKEVLETLADLLALEAEMDSLLMLLDDQEGRLLRIHRDFLEHQETALLVLVRGNTGGASSLPFSLRDEYGDATEVALSQSELQALDGGAIAQVFHGFVEPREQTWEVTIGGEVHFVTLEPAIDEITFLVLDVTEPGSLVAEAWVERWTLPGEAEAR